MAIPSRSKEIYSLLGADILCSLPVIAIVLAFIIEVVSTDNYSQDEAGLSLLVGAVFLSCLVVCFLIFLFFVNFRIISRDIFIKRKALLIGSFALMDIAITTEYFIGGSGNVAIYRQLFDLFVFMCIPAFGLLGTITFIVSCFGPKRLTA